SRKKLGYSVMSSGFTRRIKTRSPLPRASSCGSGERKVEGTLRRGDRAYQRPSSHSATQASTVRDLRREKVMRLDPLLHRARRLQVKERIRPSDDTVGIDNEDTAAILLFGLFRVWSDSHLKRIRRAEHQQRLTQIGDVLGKVLLRDVVKEGAANM